jgi:thioredoxin reductase (NADPH)
MPASICARICSLLKPGPTIAPAGQAAMHLSRHASQVTIVVRGDSLVKSMSRYLIDEIDAAANIDVAVTTQVVGGGGDGRLERLVLEDRSTGSRRTVEAAALFVLVGAKPHTEWLPASVALTGSGASRRAASAWGRSSPPTARTDAAAVAG